MHVEQSAVEERHSAQQTLARFGCSLRFGLSQALVKQAPEEHSVELLIVPITRLGLHHLQTIAEIVLRRRPRNRCFWMK